MSGMTFPQHAPSVSTLLHVVDVLDLPSPAGATQCAICSLIIDVSCRLIKLETETLDARAIRLIGQSAHADFGLRLTSHSPAAAATDYGET